MNLDESFVISSFLVPNLLAKHSNPVYSLYTFNLYLLEK